MSVELQRVDNGAPLSDRATPLRRIESTRRAIATWLLRGGVQLSHGDNAGAVAGWLSVDGRADYVYPEITGYYLQWLAWHAIRHGPTPDIASKANAAQRWLSTWAASSSPGTRVYVGTHEDDWRNQAVFLLSASPWCFNWLAWATRGLIAPDVALIENIGSLLRRLIAADGMFDACVSTSGANLDTLPQRWSGAYRGRIALPGRGDACPQGNTFPTSRSPSKAPLTPHSTPACTRPYTNRTPKRIPRCTRWKDC